VGEGDMGRLGERSKSAATYDNNSLVRNRWGKLAI
jgi:hypothetical protein